MDSYTRDIDTPFVKLESERSAGIHATEIIARVGTKLRVYPFDKFPYNPAEEFKGNLKTDIGLVFEDGIKRYLIPKFNARYGFELESAEEQHVIVEGRDFFYTPDLICHKTQTILDVKLTWRSLKNPTHQNWSYLTQLKTYLKLWGYNNGGFITCYINGNYKPPTPQLKFYQLKFSDAELEHNWVAIVNEIKQLTIKE